jgi:hypothetical protein
METSKAMLDDYSLKRILLGTAIGAVITVFVGFNGLGVMLDSSAKEMAKKSANAAVVEALAPICADNFQHAAEATKNKAALMKISSPEQGSFIEKGGWAKFPRSNTSNTSAVAEACAKMLGALK